MIVDPQGRHQWDRRATKDTSHLDRNPLDEQLQKLVAGAQEALHGVPRPTTEPGLMVCPTFCVNGELVRTIAMVARFDQAGEITLDELHVELMYPFDEAADRFFRHRATDNPGR